MLTRFVTVASNTHTHPHPLRVNTHTQSYTMFSTLGDLKGKRVLDMPCGEGRFTEQIFRSGASSVVAVDIAPKMCEMTVERMTKSGLLSADDQAAGEGKEKKLTTIVANACEPMEPLATPCDAICASFLFEYSTNQAELEMTALNLFKCAASGAPMSVIYVPGTKAKEDIAVVKEILGIEATELTPDIKPGDPVVVNYTSEAAEPFSYTIRYWPVEMVADALRKAGFVDVKVDRLSLNPEYKIDKRGFDLARFVKHTGNRLLTGRKP
mmetsp:Transcript_13764/g.32634  ORF Transcript_13764/g.32634 Transcript_13764/m.32634 type:complete len:267 (+) Transcript_13764:368-1168(+)